MSTADAYNELPYESLAFAESHPGRFGAVARLYGLPAPPLGSARVLELGCAGGGNIIPMAASLPGARFTGVDFAQAQIDAARAWLDDLDTRNCRLLCFDFRSVPLDGEFDYIIAHGLYSWVDAPVRDALLQLCREKLARNGVAYISFKTLPGWHQRQVVRDFMLFYREQFAGSGTDFQDVRKAFKTLSEQPSTPKSLYATMLKQCATMLEAQEDTYMAHEYLEAHSEPVYFRDFAAHAAAFDLAYLGDANPRFDARSNASRFDIPEQLGVIEREQYLDFHRGTQFRRALLHRPEDRVEDREDLLDDIRYSCTAAMEISTDGRGVTTFAFGEGKTYVPAGPACELLQKLAAAWPQARSPDQLAEGLATSPHHARKELQKFAMSGIVVPHLVPLSQPTGQIAHYPRASAVARSQANAGRAITNLRHENVKLNELLRRLLPLLDGATSLEDLASWVRESIATGRLRVKGAGDSDLAPDLLKAQLNVLARMALLEEG